MIGDEDGDDDDNDPDKDKGGDVDDHQVVQDCVPSRIIIGQCCLPKPVAEIVFFVLIYILPQIYCALACALGLQRVIISLQVPYSHFICLYICIFVYLYICIFVYLYICIFV